MTKTIKTMLNCGFNIRIMFLKFYVASQIAKLKRSRENYYSFHIYNKKGVSEKVAMSYAFRDTKEQAVRVMSMLRKISCEKRKIKNFSQQ